MSSVEVMELQTDHHTHIEPASRLTPHADHHVGLSSPIMSNLEHQASHYV